MMVSIKMTKRMEKGLFIGQITENIMDFGKMVVNTVKAHLNHHKVSLEGGLGKTGPE